MQALLTEGQLARHPFLAGCSPDFLNHIEEFASETSFQAGDVILHEGDYADRCYLILEGKVQLEVAGALDEPRIKIETVGPGDVLGLSWLYPPFEWHFTARALGSCTALELNAASLLVRAEEEPSFGYELMKRISFQLVHRLQATRKCLAREVHRQEDSETDSP